MPELKLRRLNNYLIGATMLNMMFKLLFLNLIISWPSFLMSNPYAASAAADDKLAAQRQTEAPALAEGNEIDAKKGIQLSWQDLHPYAMAAKVVAFYKATSPNGLSADEIIRKRILDVDLQRYDPFNKWLAYVFLMLDHRVDEEEDGFEIYQSPILEAVTNFSGLSLVDQRRLQNLICSDVVEVSDDDGVVKDSRVREFACKKALQKHQVVTAGVSEVTSIPEPIVNLILHYGDSFPWGASISEVLADRNARSLPQYKSLFEAHGILDLRRCMLRSLDGLDKCTTVPRILEAAGNFLDQANLDSLVDLDDVDLSNNFIVEVVLTQANAKIRYLNLTGNPLEELPYDFRAKLPHLVKLKSPVENYARYPRKDKVVVHKQNEKRCTCNVQ